MFMIMEKKLDINLEHYDNLAIYNIKDFSINYTSSSYFIDIKSSIISRL